MFKELLNVFSRNKPDIKHHYGFFINEKNSNTFLYQSLLRNNLDSQVYYFTSLKNKKNVTKWLCPSYCDITLFSQYQQSIAPYKKLVENKKGYYFFDMSIEAIPYQSENIFLTHQFKQFHDMLDYYSVDPEKVFFVNANLVADKFYESWRKKNNIKYKIMHPILTHQYSLGGFSDAFKKYFTTNNLFQKNIEVNQLAVSHSVKRKYYFTCLMLRPRYQRTAIMLHLLERNYLEKGIISYQGESFGNKDAPTVEKEEETFHIISRLPSGNRLNNVWDKLNQISPLQIDGLLNTISECGWAPKELGFFPRSFIEDTASPLKSYFEIVTETHFTDETCLYITEKTIWPIVSLQPFLFVGCPYSLEYLRSLGFKTFSPFIDESYDQVSDPMLRLELILKEIDRLCHLTLDEIHQVYCELWPRLLHNYYHYFNNSKALAISEIHKRILTPIINTGD